MHVSATARVLLSYKINLTHSFNPAHIPPHKHPTNHHTNPNINTQQVYSAAAGFQVASVRSDYMNSVQSICVFHPTRNVLVGANSSGRTHVFRGP